MVPISTVSSIRKSRDNPMMGLIKRSANDGYLGSGEDCDVWETEEVELSFSAVNC